MMVLVLGWPPSANRYWRSVRGKVLVSANGRAYRRDSAQRVALARYSRTAPKEPLAGRLAVRVEAFPPDARRRDIDNLLKVPLDALEKAGVYANDSQIDRLEVIRCRAVPGGRLRVTICDAGLDTDAAMA